MDQVGVNEDLSKPPSSCSGGRIPPEPPRIGSKIPPNWARTGAVVVLDETKHYGTEPDLTMSIGAAM